MSARSKIQWLEGPDGQPGATWNAVVGCAHVSPGCDHCYAATYALRGLSPTYAGLAVPSPDGARFTGEIRLLPERLDLPLRWRDPKLIFVNSQSDLFHLDVGLSFIAEVFAVMALARRHTFQILTKRERRLGALLAPVHRFPFETMVRDAAEVRLAAMPAKTRPVLDWQWPLPNVEVGVSIESNRYAFRARVLGGPKAPVAAAVRWISAEPLLGELSDLDLTGIDWVVVGCESGPRARPLPLEHVRHLRDRCYRAGVPFFVKQLTNPDGPRVLHDLDQFPEDLRIRQVPHHRLERQGATS